MGLAHCDWRMSRSSKAAAPACSGPVGPWTHETPHGAFLSEDPFRCHCATIDVLDRPSCAPIRGLARRSWAISGQGRRFLRMRAAGRHDAGTYLPLADCHDPGSFRLLLARPPEIRPEPRPACRVPALMPAPAVTVSWGTDEGPDPGGLECHSAAVVTLGVCRARRPASPPR